MPLADSSLSPPNMRMRSLTGGVFLHKRLCCSWMHLETGEILKYAPWAAASAWMKNEGRRLLLKYLFIYCALRCGHWQCGKQSHPLLFLLPLQPVHVGTRLMVLLCCLIGSWRCDPIKSATDVSLQPNILLDSLLISTVYFLDSTLRL